VYVRTCACTSRLSLSVTYTHMHMHVLCKGCITTATLYASIDLALCAVHARRAQGGIIGIANLEAAKYPDVSAHGLHAAHTPSHNAWSAHMSHCDGAAPRVLHRSRAPSMASS
jgi:hypothetical protein